MMSRCAALRIAGLVSLATLASAQYGAGLAETVALEGMAASPLAPLQLWEKQVPEGQKIMEGEQSSVTSVLATIHDILQAHLSKTDDQVGNACVALVFGALLLFVDCRIMFKWLGIAGFMLFTGLMAMNEVKARWIYGYMRGAGSVIGVEVGLAAGYAALRGFQGLMVLVGACVGALLALMVVSGSKAFGIYPFPVDGVAIVLLYSVFIFASVFATLDNRRVPFLSFATPFCGGALVSSSACWFLTGLMRPYHVAPWVDFLLMLTSSKNEDVGAYAGSGQPNKDRWIGLGLWAVLFVLGVVRQILVLRKDEK